MIGNSIARFFKLDNLVTDLTGYVETKLEILKIEIREEAIKGLAKAITYMLIAFVFSLVLIFFSIGVAIVLSDKLGSFIGWGLVGAFYLLAGIILYIKREALIRTIRDQISDTKKDQ